MPDELTTKADHNGTRRELASSPSHPASVDRLPRAEGRRIASRASALLPLPMSMLSRGGSTASTIDSAGLNACFGGTSLASTARTVFREIRSSQAIALIASPPHDAACASRPSPPPITPLPSYLE